MTKTKMALTNPGAHAWRSCIFLECFKGKNIDSALVYAVVIVVLFLQRAVRLTVAMQLKVAIEKLDEATDDIVLRKMLLLASRTRP